MDDYLLKVKVQNNRIVSLMRERGFNTVAELARACGINQSHIGTYINMTKSPLCFKKYNKKNSTDKPWSETVLKLANFFGVLPDEMFNEQQLNYELEKNTAERTINQDLLQSFLPQFEHLDPEQNYIEDKKKSVLLKMIDTLTPNEAKVLKERFGIENGEPKELDKIGKELDLTRTRVAQIQFKALGKLKARIKNFKFEDLFDKEVNEDE